MAGWDAWTQITLFGELVLLRPDHRLARPDCRSCHAPLESHAFLPYRERHMQVLGCQACHAETVDPAKVRGATGFFYFDPDGDYDLSPAGNADRLTSSWWKATQWRWRSALQTSTAAACTRTLVSGRPSG